jgi:hypothetical protein
MNNLNETGLKNLSNREKLETTGGCGGICTFFALSAAAAVGAAANEIVKDWDNFKRGLAGEPEQ